MTDDELRKLLADATPGPWRCDWDRDTVDHVTAKNGDHVVTTDSNFYTSNEDAKLIAAAPDLAAKVLMLRAALRSAEARVYTASLHQCLPSYVVSELAAIANDMADAVSSSDACPSLMDKESK